MDQTHNLPITSLTLYHQATSIPLCTAMKSNTTPKTAFHEDKCPSFLGWAHRKCCTVIPNFDQVFHFSPAPFIIPFFTKESTAGHTSYSGRTFDQVCNVRYILFIARHTFFIRYGKFGKCFFHRFRESRRISSYRLHWNKTNQTSTSQSGNGIINTMFSWNCLYISNSTLATCISVHKNL